MVDSRSDPVPREAFAERFSLLYAQAGDPPLKQVANAVARAGRVDERGRPVRVVAQRVSDWRRGRNVPARFAALAIVLEVLIVQARRRHPQPPVEGLYDVGAWRVLWRDALATPANAATEATETAADTGACPYRGLSAFRAEDSNWFFGQERSRDKLISRLADAMETGGIVTLVGASGAGKSSLVHAGLIPALSRGVLAGPSSAGWPVIVITPGDDPIKQLHTELPALAEASGPEEIRDGLAEEARRRGGEDARLVLVVDQFEETFTLCDDEDKRRQFVQTLEAVCAKGVPGLVVVAVRADFYGQCLEHPSLAEALQARSMVLGPMTVGELRDAVNGPAKAVGLQLEAGLADLMLRDLGVHSGRTKGTYNAGALPLLSHALLATWLRRQGGKLTIAGYRATGGIGRAVAETAERAWANLDPVGQTAARQILLRLVRVGEDTQDTRRRCDRDELVAQAANAGAAERALDTLASARLLTLDAEWAEITHEALLHAWPRLRRWIDQDRAGNLLRQRLEEDARAWDQEGRDNSPLYRGARLDNAQQWAAAAGQEAISQAARQFLAASVRNERRHSWARRSAVALVLVFALTAVSAAVVAVQQRDDARFQQVVSEADRLSASDPSLAALLDLVAHRMRPDDASVATRLISTQQQALAIPLPGHTAAVYLTSFSPDGNVLATASYDRTARLWDVRDRSHPKPLGSPLTGHRSWLSSAVFSPDGHTLATAGDDGTVLLWDVTDPARPVRLGDPMTGDDGTIYLVAFSPDGHLLGTADEDHTVRLWDVTDRRRPQNIGKLDGHTKRVRSVAFSPDSHTVAAGADDNTILLWDVTNPRAPAPVGGPITGFTDTVHSVAFSPDGKVLAAGSADKTVRLWNVADRAVPVAMGAPLIGHTAQVWSVAFSPDGKVLASTGNDGTARLWNMANPAKPSELEDPLAGGAGYAVSFSPDGHSVATGGQDGTVRLWSLPATIVAGHIDDVGSIAFAMDGRTMATGSTDHTVRLWDTRDPARPSPLGSPVTTDAQVWEMAFSPDGRVLATSSSDRTVQLWDTSDPAHTVPLGAHLVLGVRYSNPLAFSPDGRVLVTGHDDESVQLWDIGDPARPVRLGSPLLGHTGYVNTVSFSPDGRTLATASSDQSVRLWDVTRRDHAVPLGPALTGHTGAINSLVFDRTGHTLATGGDDKTVRLWNVTDPAHAAPLGSPLAGFSGLVKDIAFGPEGQSLAAVADDGTIQLWDVTDPARAAEYGDPLSGGSHGTANAVAFGRTRNTLATTSDSDSARLWDLDIEHAVRRICGATGGTLTPQRWQQHLPQLPYDPPCS
jgi:WD40 repeat protein/energy-coupling factor transporter ATP-binding protein EcfA2